MPGLESAVRQPRTRRRQLTSGATMTELPTNAKREPLRYKPWVLVVDDQAEIRELIQNTLDLYGYRSVGAEDGLEALRLARSMQPAAITLDLAMPRLDGHGVLAELAADGELCHVPVIIVSAYTVDLVRTAQVVEVLPKPFDVLDLVESISLALTRVAV